VFFLNVGKAVKGYIEIKKQVFYILWISIKGILIEIRGALYLISFCYCKMKVGESFLKQKNAPKDAHEFCDFKRFFAFLSNLKNEKPLY
jgi:hypothetical protein